MSTKSVPLEPEMNCPVCEMRVLLEATLALKDQMMRVKIINACQVILSEAEPCTNCAAIARQVRAIVAALR